MPSACPEQSKAKRVDFLSPALGQENVKAGRREQKGRGERNMVYSLQAYKGLQVIMRSNFPRKRGLSSSFKGKTRSRQKVRELSRLITEEGRLACGSFFPPHPALTEKRPKYRNEINNRLSIITSNMEKPAQTTAGTIQIIAHLATAFRRMFPRGIQVGY